MSHGAKVRELKPIFDFIRANPGCNRMDIARGVGMTYGKVTNHIVSMEHQGYLLAEDERSRLYAVRVVRRVGV